VLRASLKNLKNLRSLTLQNCPRIEDHTSVALCKELTSLEIENNGNFSDADLEKISQNKAIKWLKIRQCPRITDSGIKMATQNCPLKEVDLIPVNEYSI
jgi:hypothetical protein